MKYLCFLLIPLLFIACTLKENSKEPVIDTSTNPAAEGFNFKDSDSLAIDIADRVMEAQGGRQAWNELQYISWSFFGRRHLLWDKHKGRVRIESPADSMVYIVNINDKTGKAFKNGNEIVHPDSLQSEMDRAYRIWVNDSYWLCMPFKLKDSGVTLKYLREDTTQQGIESDVIQLTFNDVGVTPENKYEVWVDKSDNLIKQWAFYREFSKDTADAIWPFDNYQTYGKLKMSGDRSDGRGPGDIKTYKTVDEALFSEWDAEIK